MFKDPYISADETYYRILILEKNINGKGVKKYLWVIVRMKSKMLYLMYDNGSWSEGVILKELGDYTGIIQSDSYAPCWKSGGDDYPNIIKIGCV